MPRLRGNKDPLARSRGVADTSRGMYLERFLREMLVGFGTSYLLPLALSDVEGGAERSKRETRGVDGGIFGPSPACTFISLRSSLSRIRNQPTERSCYPEIKSQSRTTEEGGRGKMERNETKEDEEERGGGGGENGMPRKRTKGTGKRWRA